MKIEYTIQSIKIDNPAKLAGYFAAEIESLEFFGEGTYIFLFSPEFKGIEFDLKGHTSRTYQTEKAGFYTPESSKKISQSVWDMDLKAFLKGEEIKVSNADEILEHIIKLVK